MVDGEPRSGELTTANYGWTKPNVGNSDDAWGGMLNADLDGIDTTVKSVSTVANAAYPASNPSGYQTAANVTASLGGYLALSGGVMTGAMTLAADPAAALQPATKQYVDGVRYGDNRVINGDMRIDQRNNGASGTASGYTVDRWQYGSNQLSKGSWSRNLNTVTGPISAGFPYCLGFQSSSAYVSLATDYFQFFQPIEADAISDFAWGTASAQPVTLSFWVFSNQTGAFSGCIGNYAATRNYPFTFSISTANTWTRIVVTIPGDTAGTWVMSGNAGSVVLHFDLGSGANYRGVANAWTSSGIIGVTGSVSIVSVNTAAFLLTGVKLEIGSIATPYNRQSLAKSMADCQRYYQIGQFTLVNPMTSTGAGASVAFSSLCPVAMRANATMVITANNNSNLNSPALVHNGAMFEITGTSSAAGVVVVINSNFSASAEL